MAFFTTLLGNLLGYDGIILLCALLNGFYVLPRLKTSIEQLEVALSPTICVPIQHILEMLHPEKSELDIHHLRRLREEQSKKYHRYVSITSMFPLLGILGTIISLLQMTTLTADTIMSNFTLALTSTFWGLISALVFKAIDGHISPRVSFNEDSFQLLISRLDQVTTEKGESHEEKYIS